jgi:hypothetical protein
MPRKRHTEEQIVYALRQIEGGKKVIEVLAFRFKFNLARPGWRNLSISPAGSGRSPFQDNARHHLHNRQNRSHALDRAGTLH